MTVPLAGWYPDPSGAADFRWWDGTTWTESVTDDVDAPAPSDPVPLTPGEREDQQDAAALPTGPGRLRQRSGRTEANRLVALVVAVTLVVSGGVVGMIGWRTFQSARSAANPRTGNTAGHQTTTPAASASDGSRHQQTSVSGRLNEVTRRASLDTASMVLPDTPYELVGNPVSVPDAFDAMFVANAAVHPDFNGSQTWAATVGIGHVPAGSWDTGDPAAFGRRALTGISQQFFGYTPTSVRKLHYRPVTVGATACAEISANVHYAVKGLASKFDRVRIIGCPDGTDGSAVAAVSSVPDDAPHRLSTLAATALSTFRTN